ncbi:MAG: recombination mediator RecR [Bacteroidales bacterium]|jgi:recombination protein RecR|nr:recombination mediator RecR [Bacteroidales bacterium]MDD4528797.1 recombination mediator RecR [Bacteroidales bacterium]MDD4830069.1 recombination mediator RecR [Bacteroidales bacterium]
MEYPSTLVENAVNELSKLPGVGKRSALRFALYLLKQPNQATQNLIISLSKMREEIKYCKICYSLSDNEICSICSKEKRNHSQICVVENIRDILAIENTNQYQGVYHVLGGVISPIEGIGISDLTINQLIERAKSNSIEEIILALPTTMEGDTTGFYINKLLQGFNLKISAIARGIAIGDNIEFADEITLGRSIINRMPFNQIHCNNG